MDLSVENITERSFFQTSSGSNIRIDVVDGWYLVGTGFTTANLTRIFNTSDGALAIADSIILPPPYISDVIRTMYSFPLPDGIYLEEYANMVDSYYSITV